MLEVLWHSVCHQDHRGFYLTSMSSSARLEAQVLAEIERGKQDSKAVSLVRRAWLGGGLGQKRQSTRVNEKGEIEPVSAGCPIGWTTRDQSCILLLLVLTSLRETLHPVFVVSTLSSDPNPFSLTNSRSALSKSNTELERWPWHSLALQRQQVMQSYRHVLQKCHPFLTWLEAGSWFFWVLWQSTDLQGQWDNTANVMIK